MTGAGVFVYVVVILLLLGYSAMLLRRARASRHWPSTRGSIVRSESDTPALGDSSKTSARIEYVYYVDGRELRGDRISFHEHRSPGRTRELLTRYPTGSAVEVRYDPAFPSLSVLEPGANWFNYALAAFFGVLNLGLLVYVLVQNVKT